MAVQASVSRFVRHLTAAIRRYAANHGVDSTHLAIAGLRDRVTGMIYISVGVDIPFDQAEWLTGIQAAVRDEFGGIDPLIARYYLEVCLLSDLEAIDDTMSLDNDDLETIDLP